MTVASHPGPHRAGRGPGCAVACGPMLAAATGSMSSPGPQRRMSHSAAGAARLSRSGVRTTSRQTCSRDRAIPRSAGSGRRSVVTLWVPKASSTSSDQAIFADQAGKRDREGLVLTLQQPGHSRRTGRPGRRRGDVRSATARASGKHNGGHDRPRQRDRRPSHLAPPRADDSLIP